MSRNPWLDHLEARHGRGEDPEDFKDDTPDDVLATAAIAYELRAIREILAHTHDPDNHLGWHGALD